MYAFFVSCTTTYQVDGLNCFKQILSLLITCFKIKLINFNPYPENRVFENSVGRVWVMGGKHGKYVYIARKDGWYVKARLLKGRAENDPEKYIILGFKRRDVPSTYKVIKEDMLPEEVVKKLYEV